MKQPPSAWLIRRGGGKSKPQDGGKAYSLKCQIKFVSYSGLQKDLFSFHERHNHKNYRFIIIIGQVAYCYFALLKNMGCEIICKL